MRERPIPEEVPVTVGFCVSLYQLIGEEMEGRRERGAHQTRLRCLGG